MPILLTRRAALADLGGIAAATASSAFAAAQPARAATADSADGAHGAIDAAQLERFIRMRTGPELAPIMFVYEGVLLGKPDGQLAQPLLRLAGVSFNRAIARGPGRYEWQLDECGYYRDLRSGEIVMDWTNPYTGAVVHPKHYRAPENMLYTVAGVQSADPLPPGVEFRGEITTLADSGGIVSMTEDLYVRVPGRAAAGDTAAKAPSVLASLGSFSCSSEALAKPGAHWIDCFMAYNTMNSFAGWLGMEGRPGVQNMRLAGRKHPATDFAAIPGWLRRRIASDHPSFFDVPRNWSR